ncbi:MAG: DUF2807 domain-containing protein [Xanthobacteraceae bacterium]
MERFVFVAAVTIAIIFGVVAVFGGTNGFHFAFDEDGMGIDPIVEVGPGQTEAAVFAGTHLRVRSAAANVVITSEDRTDFSIEIDNSAGRAPMPTITTEGGHISIDGQLRGRIGDCEAETVELRGYGDIAYAELPRITIRAPRSLDLDLAGAGSTEIGPTESLQVDFSGCGDANIGDVAGELDIDLAGSSRVQAGAARNVDIDIAGSGEVNIGAVSEGASIDVAGSGEVTIASLNGDLSSDGAGSGDVSILAGAIGTADIDLAGAGGVSIAASVRSLEVDIVGSGDVDVNGEVGDIDAEIAGSGGVRASVVTGTVRKEVWGSGDVQVGG